MENYWATEEGRRQWREFELPRMFEEIERFEAGDAYHRPTTKNHTCMDILRQGVPESCR